MGNICEEVKVDDGTENSGGEKMDERCVRKGGLGEKNEQILNPEEKIELGKFKQEQGLWLTKIPKETV